MTNTATDASLAQILALLHDPTFITFEVEQEAPTIFNAVGRTHTETWHSALLGWLFDPQSSHGLGTYPLSRLLLLLQMQDKFDPLQREVNLHHIFAQDTMHNARVRPNERELTEVSVAAVGRFDVFIDQISLAAWQDIQILMEVKVGAPIDKHQCDRYLKYIESRKQSGFYILPVFVAPQSYLTSTSVNLFGSDAWIAISFQDIYDEVIEYCLNHQSISSFGKFTLQEYVKTLKYQQKGGKPLAISQTDSDIVQKLFEQHEPAIRALYDILSQVNDEVEPLDAGGNAAKQGFKIQVGSQEFKATSISKLYTQVLKYLHDNGHLAQLELPIASGSKRYLLATQPKHQQGNPFVRPAAYEGYVMEANKSRDGGLSDLAKLLQICGLSMKTIA